MNEWMADRFMVDVPGDVMTVNEAYTKHWSERAEHIAGTRRQVCLLLRSAKIVDWFHQPDGGPWTCKVTATPYTNHQPRQDVGACYPTVKAAVDGMVDAGLWPDDGADWVQEIVIRPEEHRPEVDHRGVVIEVRRHKVAVRRIADLTGHIRLIGG